jgi:hypothetical protein
VWVGVRGLESTVPNRLIVGVGVRGLESTVPNRLQVIGDWSGEWSLEPGELGPKREISAKGE